MSIKLDLDDSAALAVFEFLSRTLDEQNGEKLQEAVVHDGELWALNTLHGVLEKTLSEPFEADYRAHVKKALEMLVVKSGTWPKTVE
ncbi:hypothetical protein [Pelagibius sp. Alg239-R121]|uniref:hypothetical protein n=1 Tax=Pelagibius sp. Alg239-R121 TaxID=2993448 RepID=UPI0024A64922|nr:hypothetical protein [Pelagibius sp. Alg239-R121]